MTVDKLRFNLGNTNYDVPTKEYVDSHINSNNSNDFASINFNDTPIGYITFQMYLMKDYLKLDGTSLANASTDYADLLRVIQDKHLITNDSTNKVLFKYNSTTDVLTLPNYMELCLQCGNNVEEKEAGLPNIKGNVTTCVKRDSGGTLQQPTRDFTGVFDKISTANVNRLEALSGDGTLDDVGINFDASRASSIYSDSVTTVQPPAITLIPQIKYRKDTSDNVLYNDTPIGTIISYMGPTAPKDYLVCDGTVYNIDDYKELAEFINISFGSYNKFGGNGTTTFAVPDLRGEFLRGTGTNSHANQGSGANVGIHQDGTKIPRIGVDVGGSLFSYPSSTWLDVTNIDSSTASQGTFDRYSKNATGSQTGLSSYTTRPTNTSVLYCIKCITSVLSTPENNFSITEQRIGTWIDGKPLYQKTIIDTMPIVTTEGTRANKFIDVSSLNIETGVKFDGSFLQNYSNGKKYWFPINSHNTNELWSMGCFSTNTMPFDSLFIGTTRLIDSNQPLYITIQYTKTID